MSATPPVRCRAWTRASNYRTRCRNFAPVDAAGAVTGNGRCVTHRSENRKWAVIAAAADDGSQEREFIGRDYLISRITDALVRVDPEGFGDGMAIVAELYRRVPFGEPPTKDSRAMWGDARDAAAQYVEVEPIPDPPEPPA